MFCRPFGTHRRIITCHVFLHSVCLLLQSFPVMRAASALACDLFAFSCHDHSSTYIFPTAAETRKCPFLESTCICRDIVYVVDQRYSRAVVFRCNKLYKALCKLSMSWPLCNLYVQMITSGAESLERSLLVHLYEQLQMWRFVTSWWRDYK